MDLYSHPTMAEIQLSYQMLSGLSTTVICMVVKVVLGMSMKSAATSVIILVRKTRQGNLPSEIGLYHCLPATYRGLCTAALAKALAWFERGSAKMCRSRLRHPMPLWLCRAITL